MNLEFHNGAQSHYEIAPNSSYAHVILRHFFVRIKKSFISRQNVGL